MVKSKLDNKRPSRKVARRLLKQYGKHIKAWDADKPSVTLFKYGLDTYDQLVKYAK